MNPLDELKSHIKNEMKKNKVEDEVAEGFKDKKKRPVAVAAGEAVKKAPVDKSAARAKKKEMIIKLFVKDPAMHQEVMEDSRIKG